MDCSWEWPGSRRSRLQIAEYIVPRRIPAPVMPREKRTAVPRAALAITQMARCAKTPEYTADQSSAGALAGSVRDDR